jgi:hypothetical protein
MKSLFAQVITIFFGLLVGAASAQARQPLLGGCGYYVNSSGHAVSRPCGDATTQSPPPGATAICQDGTFSFSEHPYSGGTCSHHGGIERHVR